MNDTTIETTTVEAALSDAPEPCEGYMHARGLYGHVASQDAAYLVSSPCGISWLACEGWVSAAYMRVECERCGSHLKAELSFVPLVSMGER